MTSRSKVFAGIPLLFWILAVIAIAVWSQVPGYVVGWDLNVYRTAIASVRSGHDAYLDCVAARRAFFEHYGTHSGIAPPYDYVYPPITIPLLYWTGGLPETVTGRVYWTLYAIALLVAVYVGSQAAEEEERRALMWLAPLVPFFPGLLQNIALFSGNVAYVLYGLLSWTALVGWRWGKWRWYYVAVLLAGCLKPPMLTLLAIPVLSSRRQWWQAGLTGVCGLSFAALQAVVWPGTFHNYLESMRFQMVSYDHDFGGHPAGVLANALFDLVPYSWSAGLLYGVSCGLFLFILWKIRAGLLTGEISLRQGAPVLAIGAILLNPRIMEYDVAPITIPLGLVAWRSFEGTGWRRAVTITVSILLFVLLNLHAKIEWKTTECIVLVTVFFAGSWNLLSPASETATRIALPAACPPGQFGT